MKQLLVAASAPLLAASTARAQADSSNANHGVWLAASLGAVGTRALIRHGAPVASLELDVQRGSTVYSARPQFMGGLGDFDAKSLSLLVGKGTASRGVGYSAISFGPSVIKAQNCAGGCTAFSDTPRGLGPTQWGVGIFAAGDVALRFGHRYGGGIGLTGYGSLNTAKSYAGVGLELLMGRWRL
ncbi:MAG TPA: hypothetical protein VN706_12005 [Gemmatimonadaceae bacterium]|nr:hypothetical protein [Gemmatimonadaceae bacterium]